MPEKVECRYCGHLNLADATECKKCGASLADAMVQLFCDRCGIALPDGTDPVGKCIECNKPVYLCAKHRSKVIDDEIYCKDHESDCFIATAVFGTPLHPAIDTLRNMRDDWMLPNPLGRLMVHTYYDVSPPIARLARRNPMVRTILRKTVVLPALRFARKILRRQK